ncbi:unnamed protein product [Hyaloperonospora brassicae]|uniref:PLC-like phosphodiesterase n=1 Tax=Hyaloperonospora brassicae TaxID=162125 RepID=A0AAV0UUS4_HYABA|nr:unnamed protein product [Hyaloperonospora brassicae]
MNLRRWALSVFVGFFGLTSTTSLSKVQASECQNTNKIFNFLVDNLPTAYGLNTCVANNVGEFGKALASTIFSKCSLLDVYDVIKNEDFHNFVGLLKSIMEKPTEISRLMYEYMLYHSDDAMDDLCDAFSGTFGPCGGKLIPSLLPVLQKDDKCCAEFSDMIDMLNILIAPDKSMGYFMVNELINGFNQMLCSKTGRYSCGLHIFKSYTRMYTLENFDFFQHMVMPFMTIGAGEECAAFSGKPYTDTASKKTATTIDYGCCVHHIRNFIQTIQGAVKNAVGDSIWDVVGGMVSLTAPDGAFVDTLSGTLECQYDRCKNPKGMAGDVGMHRPVGANDPGKNNLVDTNCILVEKCSGDKSVCSRVCEKGSVYVPVWLKSTLAYQRNLAFSGPICLAQLPATHNSAITLADGFGNRDQLFNKNLDADKPWSYLMTNNQVLSLTDQLDIGIRFLEIDVHFFLNDLRNGHCGNLDMPGLMGFIETFGKTLGNYGVFTWGPELLGCFPSTSGIKASDQPLIRDSLDEVKAWLNAHPTEFVVLYMDTAPEMKRLDKLGAMDGLLNETFGDLLVPFEPLDRFGFDHWKGGSINELIDAGHQVLALANSKTSSAYRLHDLCAQRELIMKHIDDMPNENRQIGGLTVYGSSWIRAWGEQLRYISLSPSGLFSRALPVHMDTKSIPKFLRWNINFIALDNADISKMAAYVWSWEVDEPSITEDGVSVFMNEQGRWMTSMDATKEFRACWNGTQLEWSIVRFKEDCPPGTTFTAPTDPYQNYLLHQALGANGVVGTSLVINATLTIVGAPTPAPSAKAVIVLPSDTTPTPSSSGSASSSSSSLPSGDEEDILSSTSASAEYEKIVIASASSSSSSSSPAEVDEEDIIAWTSASSAEHEKIVIVSASSSSSSSPSSAEGDEEDIIAWTSAPSAEHEKIVIVSASSSSSSSPSSAEGDEEDIIAWTSASSAEHEKIVIVSASSSSSSSPSSAEGDEEDIIAWTSASSAEHEKTVVVSASSSSSSSPSSAEGDEEDIIAWTSASSAEHEKTVVVSASSSSSSSPSSAEGDKEDIIAWTSASSAEYEKIVIASASSSSSSPSSAEGDEEDIIAWTSASSAEHEKIVIVSASSSSSSSPSSAEGDEEDIIAWTSASSAEHEKIVIVSASSSSSSSSSAEGDEEDIIAWTSASSSGDGKNPQEDSSPPSYFGRSTDT